MSARKAAVYVLNRRVEETPGSPCCQGMHLPHSIQHLTYSCHNHKLASQAPVLRFSDGFMKLFFTPLGGGSASIGDTTYKNKNMAV